MKIVTPLPYQSKGVRKIQHFNGRALLADEMGLGKTVQALLFCHETPKDRPIIVVCPASLKWNWQHEALRHIGMRSHVLEGKTPKRNFKRCHPMLIINYDILGSWLPVLRAMKPQIVVVDESHKIANRDTKQTKNVKKLCAKIPNVICLSGTPLVNRPAELFPTLNLIRPDIYDSFFAFASRYCKPELKPWGWQYKGATNLAELHKKLLQTLMVRRRKIDVLSELPAKTRSVVTLPLTNRAEYEQAVNDFIGWLTRQSATLARKARKAEKLVKMGYLKRLVSRLKVAAVIDWIDNWLAENEGKLILFGIHRSVLGQIHERYGKQSVLVDGQLVGKQRQQAVELFNSSKRIRLFIGNIKAAGVGWSCTSASTVAFCELGWTPGEHTQGEDRIHGIGRGQKNVRAEIYYLVGRNTIESDLCRLIQNKQRVLEETLDGIGHGDQLDIFDQLENSLLRSNKEKKRAKP